MSLLSKVKCCISSFEINLSSTGIPPHIVILQDLMDINDNVSKGHQLQHQQADYVLNGVVRELEDRAIGAGTVTRDGLHDSILLCLQEAGLTRSSIADDANENDIQPTQPSNIQYQTYFWSGHIHMFPKTFKFPFGSPEIAWQYWCCGNPNLGYPPLRKLEKTRENAEATFAF
jgi:hypothetical protein